MPLEQTVRPGQRFREAGPVLFGHAALEWTVQDIFLGTDGLLYARLALASDPTQRKTLSTIVLGDSNRFVLGGEIAFSSQRPDEAEAAEPTGNPAPEMALISWWALFCRSAKAQVRKRLALAPQIVEDFGSRAQKSGSLLMHAARALLGRAPASRILSISAGAVRFGRSMRALYGAGDEPGATGSQRTAPSSSCVNRKDSLASRSRAAFALIYASIGWRWVAGWALSAVLFALTAFPLLRFYEGSKPALEGRAVETPSRTPPIRESTTTPAEASKTLAPTSDPSSAGVPESQLQAAQVTDTSAEAKAMSDRELDAKVTKSPNPRRVAIAKPASKRGARLRKEAPKAPMDAESRQILPEPAASSEPPPLQASNLRPYDGPAYDYANRQSQ